MRVTWVHPSWRDLVIDHLSDDDIARERFLRSCSVHGCLLALSSGGGVSGLRRTPLLKTDHDWDALTDRLYVLVPDLDQAELVGLLDELRLAVQGEAVNAAEARALARSVLDRLADVWRASERPIALPALEAWLVLAELQPSLPAPPALGVTWAELLPAGPPYPSDRAGVERFADWLTLVVLIAEYDATVLGELGFPGRCREHCEGFLNALVDRSRVMEADRVADADQVARALSRMAAVMPSLADRADDLRFHFGNRALTVRRTETPPTDWPRPRDGSGDVVRVLRDL